LIRRTEQSKESIWCDFLQTNESTRGGTRVQTRRASRMKVKATSETDNQAVPNTDRHSIIKQHQLQQQQQQNQWDMRNKHDDQWNKNTTK